MEAYIMFLGVVAMTALTALVLVGCGFAIYGMWLAIKRRD